MLCKLNIDYKSESSIGGDWVFEMILDQKKPHLIKWLERLKGDSTHGNIQGRLTLLQATYSNLSSPCLSSRSDQKFLLLLKNSMERKLIPIWSYIRWEKSINLSLMDASGFKKFDSENRALLAKWIWRVSAWRRWFLAPSNWCKIWATPSELLLKCVSPNTLKVSFSMDIQPPYPLLRSRWVSLLTTFKFSNENFQRASIFNLTLDLLEMLLHPFWALYQPKRIDQNSSLKTILQIFLYIPPLVMRKQSRNN